MPVCKKCGNDIPASAWSCPNCGEPSPREDNFVQVKEERPEPVKSTPLTQIISQKLPEPIKKALASLTNRPLVQKALQKLEKVPKPLRIITAVAILAAFFIGFITIGADENALKKQSQDLIASRNIILLGSTDTEALRKIGQNTDPAYKKQYLDLLLASAAKTPLAQPIVQDVQKNIKVSAELESVQIADDKQHATVNYIIAIPTNIMRKGSHEISLKNGLLQTQWEKSADTWYFTGESFADDSDE
jgi:hypothetical protein